ncbi:UNKNOWN [Stylonychia lemnae]|uniref:Uncharacterized protein n=1 Tax=Stylonychia lemnae TaxID=5949 RepID=A0A077ZQL8_STYLE|nr:UNKNOWN [Stylonychia lemnae]|eukprot:CDW71744.1 UNKNOWN [Stylonychia lemnae]
MDSSDEDGGNEELRSKFMLPKNTGNQSRVGPQYQALEIPNLQTSNIMIGKNSLSSTNCQNNQANSIQQVRPHQNSNNEEEKYQQLYLKPKSETKTKVGPQYQADIPLPIKQQKNTQSESLQQDIQLPTKSMYSLLQILSGLRDNELEQESVEPLQKKPKFDD